MNNLYHGLNKQVANFALMNVKLHHFHWYVKGPGFFTLHEKFEELYKEFSDLYDDFAERLIIIGGKPATQIKNYLEMSSISETTAVKASDMIDELISDFKLLCLELKQLVVISNDLKDDQTADLLIQTVASFEKHVWMFSSLK